MPRDVLSLVQEFLESGDERVRRNAVTALATLAGQELGGPDQSGPEQSGSNQSGSGQDGQAQRSALIDRSLSILVQTALDDPAPSTRAWAVEELRALPPEAVRRAVDELHRSLDQAKRGGQAYALLGQLHAEGRDVQLSRRSRWQRLRLALSSVLLVDPARSGKYRLDLVVPALLGGIVGFFLVLVYLVLLLESQQENLGSRLIIVLLGAVCLVPLLAQVAQRWANPISMQPDPPMALLVEIGGAAAGAFVTAFIALVFGVSLFMREALNDGSEAVRGILSAAVCTALFAAAVRSGTLLAYGIRFHGAPGPARAGERAHTLGWRLLAAIVGHAAGLLALTLGVLALDFLADHDLDPFHPILSVLWLVLLPSCAGLAYAFATIDDRAPRPVRPFARKASIPGSIVLLLLAFVPAVWIVIAAGRRPAAGSEYKTEILGERDASMVWPVPSLPFTRRFRVKPPNNGTSVAFLAEAPDSDELNSADLVTRVYGGGDGSRGNTILGEGDDPPRVLLPLRKGTYTLAVLDFNTDSLQIGQDPELGAEAVLPLLARQIRRGMSQPRDSAAAGTRTDTLFRLQVRVLSNGKVVQHLLRLENALGEIPDSSGVQAALQALDEVRKSGGDSLVSSEQYSRLCWSGARLGPGPAAQVLVPACDQAVRHDGRNRSYSLEGRAVARGLTGNRAGAISDLDRAMHLQRDTTASRPQRAESRRLIGVLRSRALTVGDLQLPGVDTAAISFDTVAVDTTMSAPAPPRTP